LIGKGEEEKKSSMFITDWRQSMQICRQGCQLNTYTGMEQNKRRDLECLIEKTPEGVPKKISSLAYAPTDRRVMSK
jgi:hypothetical protein